MGRRPERFPTWAGIIPEPARNSYLTPPGEGISRRARRAAHRDSVRPESDFDAAVTPGIEYRYAGVAPAVDRECPRIAAGDASCRDGQRRAYRIYPLPARAGRTGLSTQHHHVAHEGARRQTREQRTFGSGVQVAGEQQCLRADRHAQHAGFAPAPRGEDLEIDAVPVKSRVAAGRNRQRGSRPSAAREYAVDLPIDGEQGRARGAVGIQPRQDQKIDAAYTERSQRRTDDLRETCAMGIPRIAGVEQRDVT